MTYKIHGEVVVGNAILGRYNHMLVGNKIPVKDIYLDCDNLGKALGESGIWACRLNDSVERFVEDYPFVAKIKTKGEKKCLEINAPRERIERYFYSGLPPHIARVFDDFYEGENIRVPERPDYCIQID